MDEQAPGPLHDWSIASSRGQKGVPCARRESDPSVMLALALLAMVGTVVVVAVAAAVAWIVT